MSFKQIVGALVSNPRSLEERLIEAESKLGGMIFSKVNQEKDGNYRFWYFEGDWFFEQYNPAAGYQVVRYQILKDNIHKLFNGVEYPFLEGEKEVLIQAIKRYHAIVSKQIYGVRSSLQQ